MPLVQQSDQANTEADMATREWLIEDCKIPEAGNFRELKQAVLTFCWPHYKQGDIFELRTGELLSISEVTLSRVSMRRVIDDRTEPAPFIHRWYTQHEWHHMLRNGYAKIYDGELPDFWG